MKNLFSEITIVDCTQVFSGPFATRHFADYGATVIKIEPVQGDSSRQFPPLQLVDKKEWSGYFEVVNRNKKSLVLDLKTEEGKKILYDLCVEADIFVENFSSDVSKRLGIDYTSIKKCNENIIYASLSGISPCVNRKYYDVLAQAESGIMSLNGEKKDMKNATSIIDAFSGMKLAFALSSGLYYKEKTGKGQQIFVSMKGSAFDLLEQNLLEASLSGNNPKKIGNMDASIAPFGVFSTKNGSIVLAIGTDKQWHSFCHIFQTSSTLYSQNFLSNILRLKNIEDLKRCIEVEFSCFTSNEIVKILHEKNIPCAKVNTMNDVIADEENFTENLLQKVYKKGVGEFVVSNGGIQFYDFSLEKYETAPLLINK